MLALCVFIRTSVFSSYYYLRTAFYGLAAPLPLHHRGKLKVTRLKSAKPRVWSGMNFHLSPEGLAFERGASQRAFSADGKVF